MPASWSRFTIVLNSLTGSPVALKRTSGAKKPIVL